MEVVPRKYKILVVDDEPANLKLLREVLRQEYALIFARNGEEMLRFAQDGPDLILLDIMMPTMDGYQACASLKANPATRDIPVIFVTAKIDPTDEVKGFEFGAVDYITKPVHAAIVRARVKTHLQLLSARQLIMQQNEALMQTARLRDDVEQIVRHDLKGPLNAIIGLPGVIIAKWQLQGELESSLQAIEDSGFRLLEMINRSQDLYKMEQGLYQLVAQPVDVLLIIKRIFAEQKALVQHKQLVCEIFLQGQSVSQEDHFMVAGEELLCHSMLANLIKNGIEASPPQGGVRVLLSEQGDQVRMQIVNSGSVPVEIRATFFDKYVTAGKKQGVGLGSYSAKLIAETMRGSIGLDCGREGETRIEIILPKVTV